LLLFRLLEFSVTIPALTPAFLDHQVHVLRLALGEEAGLAWSVDHIRRLVARQNGFADWEGMVVAVTPEPDRPLVARARRQVACWQALPRTSTDPMTMVGLSLDLPGRFRDVATHMARLIPTEPGTARLLLAREEADVTTLSTLLSTLPPVPGDITPSIVRAKNWETHVRRTLQVTLSSVFGESGNPVLVGFLLDHQHTHGATLPDGVSMRETAGIMACQAVLRQDHVLVDFLLERVPDLSLSPALLARALGEATTPPAWVLFEKLHAHLPAPVFPVEVAVLAHVLEHHPHPGPELMDALGRFVALSREPARLCSTAPVLAAHLPVSEQDRAA
jgi:hypothetical protein